MSVIARLGVQFIIKYSNHVTVGFKCDLTVGSSVMNTATKMGDEKGAGTSASYSGVAGFKFPPPKHKPS